MISGFMEVVFMWAWVLILSSFVESITTFSVDSRWPDIKTVQSLNVYGSSIAVDRNDNVILLHRGGATDQVKNDTRAVIKEDVVMILSSETGKVLGTWGGNKFVKPHGIEVAGESMFITDVTMHQVFKFLSDPATGLWKNEPQIVLGERFISGNGPFHFCSPTDVAVLASTEDFFVADGYCNSRIVKFNKDGFYRDEFGAGTSSPISSFAGFVDFNVTHSITIAEISGKHLKNMTIPPLIFVADRNNGRIQSFLENGTFLYEISYEKFSKTKEMLLSVKFSAEKHVRALEEPLGTLYATVGHLPIGKSKIFETLVGYTGYHFRSSFPFTTVENKNFSSHNQRIIEFNNLETPHDIAISNDGNHVYVIEAFRNLIVKKFVKSTGEFLTSESTSGATLFSNFVLIVILTVHYVVCS